MWSAGDNRDSEKAMEFAALTGVKPIVEVFALEQAQAAFTHMQEGKAKFRAVLKIA